MTDTELKNEIRAFAEVEMRKYRLYEWIFEFSNSKSFLGLCDWRRHSIFISTHFMRGGVWKNTVLHEIAHVLAGPSHGHDRVWKMACRQVGAIPKRCGSSGLIDKSQVPEPKYLLYCKACGKVLRKSHRRTDMSGRYHGDCGILGRLEYVENPNAGKILQPTKEVTASEFDGYLQAI